MLRFDAAWGVQCHYAHATWLSLPCADGSTTLEGLHFNYVGQAQCGRNHSFIVMFLQMRHHAIAATITGFVCLSDCICPLLWLANMREFVSLQDMAARMTIQRM